MSWSKDFLLEFIELLREHEVLWKIKHKDYHTTKRTGCYMQSDGESTETTIDEIPSPRSDIASVERLSEPQQDRSFKRQKKLSVPQHVDRTIEIIGNKISEITAEDKYDAFGKNVAHKLRSLPTNQRLLAEKIINDALFEAEMEYETLESLYNNVLRRSALDAQNICKSKSKQGKDFTREQADPNLSKNTVQT
ncbi:unnamed protein product [Leptidea sinapis]|uniref:MADF domain-containing protein n=1 Tax=Leptidea sinapis TaxID=189913 RepID=A0A5E4R6M3_9NEOP|nr:unnamed protein product [Leptidea sinapis]